MLLIALVFNSIVNRVGGQFSGLSDLIVIEYPLMNVKLIV